MCLCWQPHAYLLGQQELRRICYLKEQQLQRELATNSSVSAFIFKQQMVLIWNFAFLKVLES